MSGTPARLTERRPPSLGLPVKSPLAAVAELLLGIIASRATLKQDIDHLDVPARACAVQGGEAFAVGPKGRHTPVSEQV